MASNEAPQARSLDDERQLRVAIAGFGNVGRALAEVAQLPAVSPWLRIVGVSDERFGTVMNPDGIDLFTATAATDSADHHQHEDFRPGIGVLDMIECSGADAFVELTHTNLVTGEPAATYVRRALRNGLHVTTTNKGPIALFHDELMSVADASGSTLLFEGTVMSGTPTMHTLRHHLRHAGVRSVNGILNGTTNFILTEMHSGVSFAAALAEAQAHGYAEADPSGDIEGHDAAAKLSIIAKVLLDADIRPDEIDRTSLEEITRVEDRAEVGHVWRCLATLTPGTSGWRGTVAPVQVERSHPLAGIDGPTNALTVETDLLGEVTMVGPGAGRVETAFAVLGDLIAIRELHRWPPPCR